MLTTTHRNQIIIGLALVLFMIITRGHHFDSLKKLPRASWPVFFLVGVYLRTTWPLFGFFVLAWSLDFAALYLVGANDSCLTPAYITLLPAYGSL